MADDIEQKLKELEGILGKKARALQWQYVVETDGEAKKVLEAQIKLLHARHFGFKDEIVLLPPPADAAIGEYLVGAVQYNKKNLYPFGIREKELTKHTVVVGASGSGKSNLMQYLTKQFCINLKPFILFSFKREYRSLILWAQEDRRVLSIFTCGRPTADFHFNPLAIPKGTDKETWINFVAEAMSSVYFLREGAVSFIRMGLMEVYAKHKKPKLIHLKEWVETQTSKGRAGDWQASTKRTLDALCFGRINDVLNSDDAIDLETLLDKRVILELDNFNDDDRTFIIQCLFRWLYQYALENFPRGNEARYILLVDEAHHLFLKKASDMTGKETFSDSMIRKVRELGIGLILGDQHPSLMSLPALGNTFTTITLNLKTQADVNAIGGAMLLDTEQKKFLGMLPRGFAIVKIQDRFVSPFLVQIPKVTLPYGLCTDSMISEHMKQFSGGIRSNVSAESAKENESFQGSDTKDGGMIKERTEQFELSVSCRSLLIHIAQHPFTGLSTHYRQIQISAREGTQAKEWLVANGYVKPVSIPTQRNFMTLFDLTEKAAEYLGKNGISVKHAVTEGGIEHRFGVWCVKKYFEQQGFAVEVEVKTPQGKFIDLVARKDDKAIVVLVETGKSDIDANIGNAKQAGFSDVRIIATNKEVLKKQFPVPVIFLPDLPRGLDGEQKP